VTKDYTGVDTIYYPSVPVPRDGEDVTEENWAPSWMRPADNAAYLKRLISTGLFTHTYDNSGVAAWTYGGSGSIETSIAAGHYVDVSGAKVGYKIYVDLFVLAQRTITGGGAYAHPFDFYLDAIDNATGTPGVQTHVPGAHWAATSGVTWTNGILPVNLTGVWTVAAAGTTRIAPAFNPGAGWVNSSGDTFVLTSTMSITAVLRAT
jgi:hypothetical protein